MKNQMAELLKELDCEREKSRMTQQFWEDTCYITLHEQFGFGYDRIKKFLQDWEESRKKWFAAFRDDMEADVWQEKFDMAMADFIKDNQPLLTFAERYPRVKRYGYDKQNKRWFKDGT